MASTVKANQRAKMDARLERMRNRARLDGDAIKTGLDQTSTKDPDASRAELDGLDGMVPLMPLGPAKAIAPRKYEYRGRPSSYTPEIVERILDGLRAGMTVTSICEPDDMPGPTTVYVWLDKYEDFRAAWTRARQFGVHAIVDQTIDIADRSTPDEYGRVEKDKLKIAARQWFAGRVNRQYAERQIVEHQDGNVGDIKALDDNQLLQVLSELRHAVVERDKAKAISPVPIPDKTE